MVKWWRTRVPNLLFSVGGQEGFITRRQNRLHLTGVASYRQVNQQHMHTIIVNAGGSDIGRVDVMYGEKPVSSPVRRLEMRSGRRVRVGR